MATSEASVESFVKPIAQEIIRESIASLEHSPKLGKIQSVFCDKIGLERFPVFIKCLEAGSKKKVCTEAVWHKFVVSLQDVKTERKGKQKAKIVLKMKKEDRKTRKHLMQENIMGNLSIWKYRMSLLIEILRTFLDTENHNINHKGLSGNTILHLIAALPVFSREERSFQIKLVQWLVERSPDYSIKNDQNMTALHIVAGNYLLDPNNNFSLSEQRGLNYTANTIGRYEKLSCFEGVAIKPFDYRGPNGNSILHEWVIQGALCQEEDEPDGIEDNRIGQWIITCAGVPLNAVNDRGCTPLHYAFKDRLIKFLCSKEVDLKRPNVDGETPLMSIFKHGFLCGFVNNVLPQGSTLPTWINTDRDVIIKKFICCQGSICLQVLDQSGFDLAEYDTESRDCLDLLLAVLNEFVCEECSDESVEHFKFLITEWIMKIITLKYEIINGKKVAKKTPLYQMISFFFRCCAVLKAKGIESLISECVEKMLDAGADPSVAGTDDQNTVLHHCCQYLSSSEASHQTIVKLLCEYGANKRAKNKDGKTPIEILEERQQTSMVELITCTKPKRRVDVHVNSQRFAHCKN